MDITFSPSAIEKIKEVIAKEEHHEGLALRISVQGGGCSGFQYGFSLEKEVADDDWVFEENGTKVLIDSLSYQYLAGASVEYVDTIQGSYFSIKNPNVTSECGCGSSFSA